MAEHLPLVGGSGALLVSQVFWDTGPGLAAPILYPRCTLVLYLGNPSGLRPWLLEYLRIPVIASLARCQHRRRVALARATAVGRARARNRATEDFPEALSGQDQHRLLLRDVRYG